MLKSKFEGKTRVFRKEENGKVKYSTQLSQKNIKGEWENIYIDLRFKKGTELQNKTDINIINGWLTFFKKDNGLPLYSIFVSEFETIEETNSDTGSFDLPF